MKREGEIESTTFPAPDPEDPQQLVDYQPNEDDVVSTYDGVENRDILEEFIEIAGENGKNDESEIRIVKNEGKDGVIIYDLKSRYDKNADQGWIDVTPDLSHYNPRKITYKRFSIMRLNNVDICQKMKRRGFINCMNAELIGNIIFFLLIRANYLSDSLGNNDSS